MEHFSWLNAWPSDSLRSVCLNTDVGNLVAPCVIPPVGKDLEC